MHEYRLLCSLVPVLPHLNENEIREIIVHSEATSRYERGEITTESFYREIRDALGGRFSYSFFKAVWGDLFSPVQSMIDLLPALKTRYRLVLVSNTNAFHMDYCHRHYPFLNFFDIRIYSHEVGLIKPDPRIYRKALELSGSLPAECVFIDDRMENVDGAAAEGIRAYQYIGFNRLKSDVLITVESLLLDSSLSKPAGAV